MVKKEEKDHFPKIDVAGFFDRFRHMSDNDLSLKFAIQGMGIRDDRSVFQSFKPTSIDLVAFPSVPNAIPNAAPESVPKVSPDIFKDFMKVKHSIKIQPRIEIRESKTLGRSTIRSRGPRWHRKKRMRKKRMSAGEEVWTIKETCEDLCYKIDPSGLPNMGFRRQFEPIILWCSSSIYKKVMKLVKEKKRDPCDIGESILQQFLFP